MKTFLKLIVALLLIISGVIAAYFLTDPFQGTLVIENHLAEAIEVKPVELKENSFTFRRLDDGQIHTIEFNKLSSASALKVRKLPLGKSRFATTRIKITDELSRLKEFYYAKTSKKMGRVVRVIDGDSIILRVGSNFSAMRVRLQGIDAPEYDQIFGSISSEALSDKILHQMVSYESHGGDAYGRTLATIFLDGESINFWMVDNGYAWWYRQYSNDQLLKLAESRARESGRGLWSIKPVIAPWDFRKN